MTSSDEYQSLRQELVETFNRELNLIAFGFGATAVIIGYGFTASDPRPFVFLVPLPILALLLYLLNQTLYTVLTLSVYIRVFIEAKNEAHNWETTIDLLRTEYRQAAQSSKTSKRLLALPWDLITKFFRQMQVRPLKDFSEYHYAIGIVALGAVCILLFFLNDNTSYRYWVSIIAVIVWLAVSVITLIPIRYANTGQLEVELKNKYKELKPKVRVDM